VSTVVEARAPGKLFVLGEYAVLDGCPAVIAAVNRFVTAVVHLGSHGCEVRIDAEAHGGMRFDARNPPPEDGPLRFVLAAWRSATDRWPELAQHDLRIEVSSTLEDPQVGKTGLGGSAATVVATAAALHAAAGAPTETAADRTVLLATALAAHRRAQGGTGSGGDVAASVWGGIILFAPRGEALPEVTRLPWPTGAELLAGWSGTAASTTGLVQRYRAAAAGAPVRAGFLERTRGTVAEFVAAVQDGRLAFDAINTAGDTLERLGTDLEVPIVTPVLRRLVVAARGCGAAAKASGAGGGDCAIALARDAAGAAAVRRAWQDAGFKALDLALSQEGVTIARR